MCTSWPYDVKKEKAQAKISLIGKTVIYHCRFCRKLAFWNFFPMRTGKRVDRKMTANAAEQWRQKTKAPGWEQTRSSGHRERLKTSTVLRSVTLIIHVLPRYCSKHFTKTSSSALLLVIIPSTRLTLHPGKMRSRSREKPNRLTCPRTHNQQAAQWRLGLGSPGVPLLTEGSAPLHNRLLMR